MHIVLFSPTWPPKANANGITSYCGNLKPGLEKLGHRVTIITPQQSQHRGSSVHNLSYKLGPFTRVYLNIVERINSGYRHYFTGSRSIVACLEKIAIQCPIDVFEIEESFGWHLHIQNAVDFPVVIRLHGPHYINGTMDGIKPNQEDQNRFRREKKAFRAARYLTAPCHWIRNDVQNKYKLEWQASEVIYNPVAETPEQSRWQFSLAKPFQILFVGRFDKHKGGDLILKAFSEILKTHPHANLLFAGPDRGIIENNRVVKIHEFIDLNFSDSEKANLDYLGFVDSKKIETLRRNSAVAVVASTLKNFPYTALESLSLGLPLVASKVGGIAEIFEDSISGVYFEKDNADDLAAKVVELLNDNERLELISENGLKRCHDVFRPEVISQQTLDFYKVAIAQERDST